MEKVYIVTGACGHLGSALVSMLVERGEAVRCLVLPGERSDFLHGLPVTVVEGDVRNPDRLDELMGVDAVQKVVIHTAGVVDILSKHSVLMEDVNINGARNIVDACRRQNVSRLIYVSSVHAIPELPDGRVIAEVSRFHPDAVEGAYAKTKAAATRIVLEAAQAGLPAVVVHPSGIIGPYCGGGNHLVEMLKSYLDGRLNCCVKGGYDFVDVRDVAEGCLSAAELGRIGQCYVLSNRYYSIREVLNMLRSIAGGRRVRVAPLWMAKMAAPALSRAARRRGRKPLFTKYSLYTLGANGRFSHDLASRELGYYPRDLYDTLTDTARWLYEHGECAKPGLKRTARLRLHGCRI